MKHIVSVSLLLILIGCAAKTHRNAENKDTITTTGQGDTQQLVSSNPVPTIESNREYAQKLISGEVKASDDEKTFAWLDSLQSGNFETRQLAFKVYEAIASKSDGSVSEVIGGYMKKYLSLFPKEFLQNAAHLSAGQQNKLYEFIAFEFYASGSGYKADLEDYFNETNANCMNCSHEERLSLASIKTMIEEWVKKTQD
ncbi:hypothetical protein [Foetidibacter luteolus]|uniref:hypothetical protein n=1 Tax=Foetidibacter luteolus TaxID=2608880 RepID=UPI00129BC048|nr:hypothetical protein [Foetidibacter luteolus]